MSGNCWEHVRTLVAISSLNCHQNGHMCVCGFVRFFVFVCGSSDRYLKHFLCQSQNCRNCRSIGAWEQGHLCFFLYDDCACSVLAAKHPPLFAEVHWTSLAAGRTTSPQALGWTAIPWQQGSTLDYPCQRGSSGICIPDIAGDNPCDIGPPSHGHWISMLGRQSLVVLWKCALRVGKISSCCCALSKALRNSLFSAKLRLCSNNK